ncbi:hypothetical protein L5515_000439 [Caenorhabditis briggsae]|uniref:Phytanoyl-CoA hydroxylase-interacting protein-like C-terminal domain-containing protein n=2 Tax=Caenorhabditis briggsae TaxID=6238 RepID=A0AAE9E1I7_CAEBR|nr:hypothetical protein L5515_000439 [Caenorhabditis briggsae]
MKNQYASPLLLPPSSPFSTKLHSPRQCGVSLLHCCVVQQGKNVHNAFFFSFFYFARRGGIRFTFYQCDTSSVMMSQLHHHSLNVNRQSDNQNTVNYDLQLAPTVSNEGILPPNQAYWFMEPYPSDNNPQDGYYLQPVPVHEPNYVPQDSYHQPANYEPIPPLMGYSSDMVVPQSNAQYYVGHDNQQAYQFGYPTDPANSTQIMDSNFNMMSTNYQMPANQTFGQYTSDHNATGMVPYNDQDFWNSGIANYQMMPEPIQINNTHSNDHIYAHGQPEHNSTGSSAYHMTSMVSTYSNSKDIGSYGHGPEQTPINTNHSNGQNYGRGPLEQNSSRSSASQMTPMVTAHSNGHQMPTTHLDGYGNYGHVPPVHSSSGSSASQMASMVPAHSNGQNFNQYCHGLAEQTSKVSSNVPVYCNSVAASGNQPTNPMSYSNQMIPMVPTDSNGQNFSQYAYFPPEQNSSVSAPVYCNPVVAQGNQSTNSFSYPNQMTSQAPASHSYCSQPVGQSAAPTQWTAPPTVQNAQHFADNFPDVGHWGAYGVSNNSSKPEQIVAKPVTTSRHQNSGKYVSRSAQNASHTSMIPKQAATRMNQNGNYGQNRSASRYKTSNSGQQESRNSFAQTASKNGNSNYRMNPSQPATSSNVNYRTTRRNDPEQRNRTANGPIGNIPEFDSRIPPPVGEWGVYGAHNRASNDNYQKTNNLQSNGLSTSYKPSSTTNYKTAAKQTSSTGYTPNRNHKSQFDEYGRSRPSNQGNTSYSPRTSRPANQGNGSQNTGQSSYRQGPAPRNNAYGPLTVQIEEQSYPSTPSTEESKRNSKANLEVVPSDQKTIEIGPRKLNVRTVVCSEQIVLFIEMPAGYSSVQYFISTKMTFEDEWTMFKVYGNTPRTVYQIRTVAGKSYNLSVTCQSNEKVFIGEWGGKVRSVFSHQEFTYLHLKCAIFIDSNQQIPQMQEISVVYRCKPKEYWDQIKTHCQRMMYKYNKVVNGQPANLLNRRLAGLFFSTFIKSDGSLPKTSLFGDVRFSMPAGILLDPRVHRLYFGDFYCRSKRHYVTLVVTRKGSEADMYCFTNLLSLHPLFNPYLKIIHDNGNWRFFVATAVTVDLLYTENVHTCFGRLSPVEPRGGNLHGVYPNDKTCRMCNLYPKQLMLH